MDNLSKWTVGTILLTLNLEIHNLLDVAVIPFTKT